jgi:Tol biopolymer transport system component/DNA-binding winged helix-turn-helix (wHTH) protein
MSSGLRFGDYVLDARGHTLRRGDSAEVHLGERALGVLNLLVENAGRVVSRRELIDTVWRDVIVSDDSLARAVSDIRTALGDDAAHARFIRTVHRQGYVFVAPVRPADEASTDPGPSAPARTPRDERRRVRGLTVPIVVAAVVAVAAFALWERNRPAGVERAAAPTDLATWHVRALGPRPFTASAIKPSFAKTSNLLAVVAPDPDTHAHSLFLLQPDGGTPLQMTREMEVRGPSPEFTYDDSHVIFTSYHSDPELGMVPDVWLAPVPTGEPTLLLEGASAASSSPDGRAYVYAAVTSTGTSIRVRHGDGRDLEVAGHGFWPRWSPDGRWIAYTTSDPEGGDGTIHVVRPDGTEDRELTGTRSQVYGLCWSPDSSRVIFASEQTGPMSLWSVDIENRSQQSITRGPGGSASPTLAPDGRRLVFDFSQRRWSLFLASVAEEQARRVLVEAGMRDAAVSPDGHRVAIAYGAEAETPAVRVLDVRSGERHTISGMAASAVAWMPDGRSVLAAAAAPDGISQWIWRLPVDGGLPDPILKGEERWDAPRAGPDGTRIAAVRIGETGSELVVHDLERGERRVVAERSVILAPRWSPDGRRLAWSGSWRPDDLVSGGIWVGEVEAGTPRRLTVEGAWPQWEADGRHLLFARFLEHDGIWRIGLDGGSPALVRRLEDEMAGLYLEGLDVGRPGGPLLFFLSRTEGELYVLEPPDR